MKVTLAYPYDGHDPDETVDLDDAIATQLVHDGLARLPEPRKSKPTTPEGA